MQTSEIPLATVKGIAVRAGAAALEIYNAQDAWVQEKADGSPLTEADMASEQVIGAALRPLDPSIPYLSEESAQLGYATRREWRRFWLVDPLDGTKEFIKRTHEFTINIALIEDGQPVLGVIVAPAVGAVYYASKYQGAWKEQDSGQPKRLGSRLADVGRPLRIVESVSHPSPELEQFLESFQISDRLKIGSSLKFCLLAEGTADVYPRARSHDGMGRRGRRLHLPILGCRWDTPPKPPHLQQGVVAKRLFRTRAGTGNLHFTPPARSASSTRSAR